MKLVTDISKMRKLSLAAKANGETVGLVPTMGYLHEGHASLIRAARAKTDLVVVSIFVNPTQFAPREDFERYPRDLRRDKRLAKQAGADIIFHPSAAEMYPEGFSTYVEETALSKHLCGLSRPTHFRGVTTVVLKLFNIVQPDVAYFGQKDAQQALIIKRMVRDLNVPIRISVVPIVREADWLALSSRNEYLSPEERKEATVLYRALMEARKLVRMGVTDPSRIKRTIRRMIKSSRGAKTDYVSVVDRDSLEDVKELRGNVLIALSVFIGKTRLIDNIGLNVPSPKNEKMTK
jgi:pantoate--beta-alanine ligase